MIHLKTVNDARKKLHSPLEFSDGLPFTSLGQIDNRLRNIFL